jgi:hypothetical protein
VLTKKNQSERARIGTIAVIAAGLVVFYLAGQVLSAYGAADGQPIAGIPCDREEGTAFHVHAHLNVFVDGKPYPVPEGVGIVGRMCLYWLHTHDQSGIVHVEAPQRRIFTLDQFFDIWKATAKGAPPVKQKPKIFVNGKRVNGGLDQVEIADLAEIAVVYGKDPPKIPSSFDFPATYRKG